MVTQERLKQLFAYCEETGTFTRIAYVINTKIGDVVGTLNYHTGYVAMRVDGKVYYVHRMAWLYVHGSLPKMLDHINRDKTDNRITNLRSTTYVRNRQNTGIRKNNISGFTGVVYLPRSKKWRASISRGGATVHLGTFIEIGDAIRARVKAELLHST